MLAFTSMTVSETPNSPMTGIVHEKNIRCMSINVDDYRHGAGRFQ
jgi:hypothetical protein